MRKRMEKLENERAQFRGSFERLGEKRNWHGYPETTVMLKDVILTETGEVVTEHLWFNYTLGFEFYFKYFLCLG